MIAIEVFGVPIPKGSTRAFVPKGWTRPIVTSDNAKTKPWQESITQAAIEARGAAPPIEEPVSLVVRFYLPRPKTAPKRVCVPAKKPDLDKLLRALKDGLTRGGIYRDDAQVVEIKASKAFAAGHQDPAGAAGVPRAVVEVHFAMTRQAVEQLALVPRAAPNVSPNRAIVSPGTASVSSQTSAKPEPEDAFA